MCIRDSYEVLIVGGGPAGASAAVYTARKGIRTGLVAERFGGQVLDTMAIENFVSVPYTEGPTFAANLEEHVKKYEVDIMKGSAATKLVPASEPGGLHTVEFGAGSLKAKTVVVDTGARWRHMGVPGEAEYRNKGVTFCPHCDGPLFKGKRIAVSYTHLDVYKRQGGCKGTLRVALTTTGVAAHSGRPWLGDNAVHKLAAALATLASYEARVVEVDGLTYHEGLSAVGISGGAGNNVVPDRARLLVNYRFAPDLDGAGAVAHVREVFAGYDVEVVDLAEGARPGLHLPAARDFVAALGVPVSGKEGWTDAVSYTHLDVYKRQA